MLAALLAATLATPLPKSWMLGPFYREDSANPVLRPSVAPKFLDPMSGKRIAWRSDNVFNPALTVRGGRLWLLFRAEDDSGTGIGGHTSRIGLADSSNGRVFTARERPVLFPAQDKWKPFDWPGGCEDPRIVNGPNGYVLTYTTWNRKTARLSVATSKDLYHWHKTGPAFGRVDHGKWLNFWSKSGAIVTKLVGGHLEAAKISGRYWMYFGDLDVSLATSTNLIDWTPLTGKDGRPKPVLHRRKGKFDSALCESGPPALLEKQGIVLLYNGANGDPGISNGAYSAGQALFASTDPSKLLDRSDRPFLRPERPYEVTGQYRGGTVFIEGLARFRGHWFLAYGAADSLVGMARTR